MTAAEELVRLANAAVAAGEFTSVREAAPTIQKRHAAVYKRYRQERQQPVPATAPPLDYSQRQALHKQGLTPTVPPPRSPQEEWLGMIERILEANPGMSYDAASWAAYQQDGGKQAKERYRQQQLFGQMG